MVTGVPYKSSRVGEYYLCQFIDEETEVQSKVMSLASVTLWSAAESEPETGLMASGP